LHNTTVCRPRSIKHPNQIDFYFLHNLKNT
jgi:hypothetical protein